MPTQKYNKYKYSRPCIQPETFLKLYIHKTVIQVIKPFITQCHYGVDILDLFENI